MQNFDIMEPVVEAICNSLETEPESWTFKPHIMWHPEFKVFSTSSSSITHAWDSTRKIEVFSEEQGKRIKKSYDLAYSKIGNTTQQKLIKSVTKLSPSSNPSKTTTQKVSFLSNLKKTLLGAFIHEK